MLKTLTKSRFKLGLDCPTKVFYDANRDLYKNLSSEDDFLQMLAYGGHQVGALAKLMFTREDPKAVEVTDLCQDDQIARTRDLLARDSVIIFEGTLRSGNLLLRADVIRKRANVLDLIEVKATGWDPMEDSLTGKTDRSNPLVPEFEGYVYDVAFQHHVVSTLYPELSVRPWLMFLDTNARVDFEGLAKGFVKQSEGDRSSIVPRPDIDWTSLDSIPLVMVDAAEAVRIAQSISRPRRGRDPIVFSEAIASLSLALAEGDRPRPSLSSSCKSCPFYVDPSDGSPPRSGWHECMQTRFGQVIDTSRKSSIFGFYGQLKYDEILSQGHLEMSKLDDDGVLEDVEFDDGKLSLKARQRLQLLESKGRVDRLVFDRATLNRVCANWVFPLHFIDFETSRTALPYFRGHRPYQQVLFQFSHHIVHEDGRLEHKTECLIAEPGRNPSIDVVRSLLAAIGNDDGTVFHWYPHERTVLSEIATEIAHAGPHDADLLRNFLDSLGLKNGANRRLFDLGRFFENYIYIPSSFGSSSMKRVLPALFKHSPVLREIYESPVYGTRDMPSLNFISKAWYREQDGITINPYEQLGSRFSDEWIEAELSAIEDQEGESFMQGVADGAAAIIAFDKLQSPELPQHERNLLSAQLRRYCELDTLAMVMAYQVIAASLEADKH